MQDYCNVVIALPTVLFLVVWAMTYTFYRNIFFISLMGFEFHNSFPENRKNQTTFRFCSNLKGKYLQTIYFIHFLTINRIKQKLLRSVVLYFIKFAIVSNSTQVRVFNVKPALDLKIFSKCVVFIKYYQFPLRYCSKIFTNLSDLK